MQKKKGNKMLYREYFIDAGYPFYTSFIVI